MNKKLIPLIVLITYGMNAFAQSKDVVGNYSYSRQGFNENIIFEPNGQFRWSLSAEFLDLNATGVWQVRNDTIFLNSYPQKDGLIVWEARTEGLKKEAFYVADKTKEYINYTFFGITTNDDTIRLANQWKKTEVPEDLKGFYIMDTKGLVSPAYYINGYRSNTFYVYFETRKVFENESWIIKDGNIMPRGVDGILQKYYLVKK